MRAPARRIRRPRYVHKRQESGSNETVKAIESGRGVHRKGSDGESRTESTTPTILPTTSISLTNSRSATSQISQPSSSSKSIAQLVTSIPPEPSVAQALGIQAPESSASPTLATSTLQPSTSSLSTSSVAQGLAIQAPDSSATLPSTSVIPAISTTSSLPVPTILPGLALQAPESDTQSTSATPTVPTTAAAPAASKSVASTISATQDGPSTSIAGVPSAPPTTSESKAPVSAVDQDIPSSTASTLTTDPTTGTAEPETTTALASAKKLVAAAETSSTTGVPVAAVQQEPTFSSIIVNSVQATAGTTSIPLPTFASISSIAGPESSTIESSSVTPTTSVVAGSDSSGTISSGSSSTSSGALPSGQVASASNSAVPADGSSNNTATIAGAIVGSVVAFVLLALLGVCLIRRHYKSRSDTRVTSSRSSSRNQALLSSPSPMAETPRSQPTAVFTRQQPLRTISEQSSRTASPEFLPPFRHSRSYTTTSIPPAIPSRSALRPPSHAQLKQAPVQAIPAFTIPPPPHQEASASKESLALDSSFMGTISTYFSTSPRNSTAQGPQSNHTRQQSRMTASSYTISPYTSLAPSPITPKSTSEIISPISPLQITASQLPILKVPTPPLPSRTPTLPSRPITFTSQYSQPLGSRQATPAPSTQSQTRNTSRFQSLLPSAWRDSMWSTSATTPMRSGHNSKDLLGEYFPAALRRGSARASHRSSRSLGDVLDWRDDRVPAGAGWERTPSGSDLREGWGIGMAR